MNGFESSKIKANEISDVMNFDKTFKKKRLRKTKKQFDYENSDEINECSDLKTISEHFILML